VLMSTWRCTAVVVPASDGPGTPCLAVSVPSLRLGIKPWCLNGPRPPPSAQFDRTRHAKSMRAALRRSLPMTLCGGRGCSEPLRIRLDGAPRGVLRGTRPPRCWSAHAATAFVSNGDNAVATASASFINRSRVVWAHTGGHDRTSLFRWSACGGAARRARSVRRPAR
jgi:hypothetical protein